MDKVYLALYKGRASDWRERLEDWLIRQLTRGAYSHCELVIARLEFVSGGHYEHETVYDCYTSSSRDGGVRLKQINMQSGKWELIPLNLEPARIKFWYDTTKGKKYDFWGALGVILKSPQHKQRYFCSEWCGEVLGVKEPWRFSPNDLAAIVRSKL